MKVVTMMVAGILSLSIAFRVCDGHDGLHRRSLLPKTAFHHVTNLSILVSNITTNIIHQTLVDMVEEELNEYCLKTFGDTTQFNLTMVSFQTLSSDQIALHLLLYTKSIFGEEDMNAMSTYFDEHSQFAPYTVQITHITESVNSGETEDLMSEIVIVSALLICICVFSIAYWSRVSLFRKKDANAFLAKDDKSDAVDFDMASQPKTFEMISLPPNDNESEKKSAQENQMVQSIERAEKAVSKTEEQKEQTIGDAHEKDIEENKVEEEKSVRDEDDEKAPEIELQATDKIFGEPIIDEDD